MQIPSSCGLLEDIAWGVAAVLAALLVLPLLPLAVIARLADRRAHVR